ncbi:putative ribonuclease H-like domain-containing protein [Tanacetum coccineum]
MPRNRLVLIKPKSSAIIATRQDFLERPNKGTQDNKRRDAWNLENKAGNEDWLREDCNALGAIDEEVSSYQSLREKKICLMVAKFRSGHRDLDDDVLTYHKKLLAEAEKEKEDLKAKVEKWHNSSKNLGKLLNTQMSANDKFGLGYGDYRYDGILSYENEVLQSVFMNKESELENQPLYDRFVTAGGMHVVPPPMTGNYMPSGPDIEIDYSQFTYGPKQSQTSESETQTSDFDTCESDYSEDEHVSLPTEEQETPSFANQQVKTPRKTVKNQFTHSKNPKVDKKDKSMFFSTTRASGTNNVSTARQNFKSQAVLTNAARKISTVKPFVNRVRSKTVFHKTHSPFRRPFNNTTALRTNFSKQKVNTAEDYPHRDLQNKGIVDSVCSKHMAGNKAYLAEYQDFNGGLVAFGGSKGYITGIGKIKTGKLDFEDVCFVKELQHFNLFSVSQICDKKNKVLFTDSECLVLTPEFKLPDANQVILRIPRQSNMYSFNLENLVPFGGKPCTRFTSCRKESNTRPPVRPKQFSWVFFLRTKDETSAILKDFIRQIENQLNQKVKTIRSDNGTEFKNKDVIEFCGLKGIKREYNNARTLQQNVVAKRKNRTLIEAARTMLAESFLPNTFWAKAVSTDCFVLPICPSYSSTTPASKTDDKRDDPKEEEQVFMDELERLKRQEKEAIEEAKNLRKKFETLVIQEGAAKTSSTNIFSTVSTPAKASSTNLINTISIPVSTASPNEGLSLSDPINTEEDDSKIPPLEDIYQDSTDGIFTTSSFDDEGAVADFTNLETVVNVSPIPTLRIHYSHPSALILGDPTSAVQTRSKVNKSSGAYAFLSYVQKQRRNNHKDFQHCLFACFLSQNEPKKISEALEDESWVDAMQEELLQFKIQKVWVLVDLPYGKKAIGTKWVYRNKKDERGVVDRNKARLVAQGHRQEEGIDYDEVFALVARIKAIRIFLAFASYMGFIVYQMDVKSAFLYGKIDEEVYVSQPPGFLDPKYPQKVYKVVKALYGLHQAPRAWYATLSAFLLKNGYKRGTINKTLFLKKDKKDIILVQVYVDDIIFGSTKKSWCDEFEALMKSRFQMSSMGELTFFLRLLVKQKEDGIFISQDKYVAEILKKFDFASVKTASTPIETQKPLVKDEEASDVDVHLYRSMIGSLMYLTASRPDIMFAVCACSRFQVTLKTSHLSAVKRIFRYLKGKPKLGLWYPRVSTFDLESYSDSDYAGANLDRKSTTGEAEYVAAASCCGQNPVYHSKTKHIAIRHHFIRDAYEKKLIQVLKIHTDDNVADLLTKAFDVSRRVTDGIEALLIPTLFILWLDKVSTDSAKLVPPRKGIHFSGNSHSFVWLYVGPPTRIGVLFKKVHLQHNLHPLCSHSESYLDEPQTDSSPTQTSEVAFEHQTDLSPSPSPIPLIPNSIPETSGENLRGHSSSDKSLSGTEVKAVSKEKEKGVELKDVEETDRPGPTSTRSLFTLKPLPKIDPKDKGKKKIEEDDMMVRKIHRRSVEKKGEEERNRIAKEKAANEALIRNFDDIKARIEVDRLLAEKLQEQEREQFSIEERAKFLPETIASQRKFLAQQRSEAIRNRHQRRIIEESMMNLLKACRNTLSMLN